VIDNQDQAERLLQKLTEALPLSALATPALLASLRGRSSAAKITVNCTVTKVFYLGDEGGSRATSARCDTQAVIQGSGAQSATRAGSSASSSSAAMFSSVISRRS